MGYIAIGSAAATVASGAIGFRKGRSAADKILDWANTVRAEDTRRLLNGELIPPLAMLPEPRPRKLKSIWLCYLGGIALGGFIGWLLTFVVCQFVIALTGQEVGLAERLISSLIIAAGGGLVGLVPGTILGSAFWLLEVRNRFRQFDAETRHALGVERENLRQGLQAGTLTVPAALEQLGPII